jgi:hypothetical protein
MTEFKLGHYSNFDAQSLVASRSGAILAPRFGTDDLDLSNLNVESG